MRRVSKFIQLEIRFTEVGRNLGGKYLEPADRFRPKAEVQGTKDDNCFAAVADHRQL